MSPSGRAMKSGIVEEIARINPAAYASFVLEYVTCMTTGAKSVDESCRAFFNKLKEENQREIALAGEHGFEPPWKAFHKGYNFVHVAPNEQHFRTKTEACKFAGINFRPKNMPSSRSPDISQKSLPCSPTCPTILQPMTESMRSKNAMVISPGSR